jgi:hypothetical protein
LVTAIFAVCRAAWSHFAITAYVSASATSSAFSVFYAPFCTAQYRYSRPRDFAAFRAANWPDVNEERWKLLADLLERDSEYWIYFSF